MSKQTFLTDIYRMVQGSFSIQNTLDHEGKPLDPSKYNWWAGLAIPKTPGIMDWKQETGNTTLMSILKAGQESYPNGEWQSPDFSWKVKDGDSLDKKGNQHYPGHWIVGFSRNQAIGPVHCYDQQVKEMLPNLTERGWYYRIQGSTVGNGRTGRQAGVYVNMEMVQLCSAKPEDKLVSAPDATQVFSVVSNSQQTTVTQPQTTVTQPQTTVTQPQTTVTQPQTTVTQPQTLSITPMGQGMAPTIEALKSMMPGLSDDQLVASGFAVKAVQQVLVITEQGKNMAPTIEVLKSMMPGLSDDQLVASGFAVRTTPAPGFLAGNGQY